MSSLTRKFTPDDKDAVLEILAYAYGIPEPSNERFLERLDLIGHEFFVHEVDGIPVATARALELEQNLRGTLKPMGGIGMVASVPEYRRRGYTRKLMLDILAELHEKGYATSTLYPFKDTFYSAMGYVKMPPTLELQIDPKNLGGIQEVDGYSVSREDGEKPIEIYKRMHEQMVRQTHGAALRNEVRWQETTTNMRSKTAVTRDKEGEPKGIMLYQIKGYGDGHSWAETGEMTVYHLYWENLDARDALLRFLYTHMDQIVKVKFKISCLTDDYYHWISGYHTPDIKANIVSMARIVGIKDCFNGLKSDVDGSCSVRVNDEQFEWNNGVFDFSVQDGTMCVEESEKSSKIEITIQGLTALLYGTLDRPRLKRLGWLKGEAPDILFDWFSPANPFLTESF